MSYGPGYGGSTAAPLSAASVLPHSHSLYPGNGICLDQLSAVAPVYYDVSAHHTLPGAPPPPYDASHAAPIAAATSTAETPSRSDVRRPTLYHGRTYSNMSSSDSSVCYLPSPGATTPTAAHAQWGCEAGSHQPYATVPAANATSASPPHYDAPTSYGLSPAVNPSSGLCPCADCAAAAAAHSAVTLPTLYRPQGAYPTPMHHHHHHVPMYQPMYASVPLDKDNTTAVSVPSTPEARPVDSLGSARMSISDGVGSNSSLPSMSASQQDVNHTSVTRDCAQPSAETTADATSVAITHGKSSNTSAQSVARASGVIAHRGSILRAGCDAQSCRTIQSAITHQATRNVHYHWIFEEALASLQTLCMDPFGSNLLQTLVEHASIEQRCSIWAGLAPTFVSVCQSLYGTRVAQKLTDVIGTHAEWASFHAAANGRISELVRDEHAAHVVLKAMRKPDVSIYATFIFNEMATYCEDIAMHRQGCLLLQRGLELAPPASRATLLSRVTELAGILMFDPFGNYVVQYVLDLRLPGVSHDIGLVCTHEIDRAACDKFASNVIEKCIRQASAVLRAAIVAKLAQPEVMQAVMQDSYANYVLQTALDESTAEQHATLISVASKYAHHLSNSPYGKRLHARITNSHQHSTKGNHGNHHHHHSHRAGSHHSGHGYHQRSRHQRQDGHA